MSIYKKIISNLRVLIKAGETPAIQLTDRASKILGLAKTVQEHIGGECFLLEPGATARGLIKRYKSSFEKIKEPKETGKTFLENAVLKAQFVSKRSDNLALADDSGLCVNSLGGQPGIYNARWAGKNKDFKLAI